MRIAAVLNRDSGTLKTSDVDAIARHIDREFRSTGHLIDCRVVGGDGYEAAIEEAAAADVVLAAGGDGSISAAAALCWRHKKALAILPAGTMNLVARTLGVPLDIHAAVSALAQGHIINCDIATANGQPFIHQYSVGLQPMIVADRNKYDYGSRLGKMAASLRAMVARLRRPPRETVVWETEKERRQDRLSILAVSNNPYGPGHMPFADRLDQGVLGFYRAPVLSAGANLKLAADLVAGTWESNPDFSQEICRRVDLTFPSRRKNAIALIDGELIALEHAVSIAIHPGELRILTPKMHSGEQQ